MIDLKNDSHTKIFNLTVDEIWSEFMSLGNTPPFGLLRCAAIHIPEQERNNADFTKVFPLVNSKYLPFHFVIPFLIIL